MRVRKTDHFLRLFYLSLVISDREIKYTFLEKAKPSTIYMFYLSPDFVPNSNSFNREGYSKVKRRATDGKNIVALKVKGTNKRKIPAT